MNNPPSPFRSLPTSLKLRRTRRRDRITNFLCLNLLLLGATALGMDNSPEKQLLNAARDGDIKEVKRLIRDGVSVEAKEDILECTPLAYAARCAHLDVCKLLIANKASVDAQGNHGWTPLIWAAEIGHAAVCRFLIKNKASVEMKADGGQTPLMLAARCGLEGVCKLLIENKASVEAQCNMGRAPLHYAACGGSEAVCRLLIAHGASVEGESSDRVTPLTLAVMWRRRDVCKLFIDTQLEPVRKNKPAIATFVGIVRKRPASLPCQMQKDIAQLIARQTFQLALWPVIEQIKGIENKKMQAKCLAYINDQMNLVNK